MSQEVLASAERAEGGEGKGEVGHQDVWHSKGLVTHGDAKRDIRAITGAITLTPTDHADPLPFVNVHYQVLRHMGSEFRAQFKLSRMVAESPATQQGR